MAVPRHSLLKNGAGSWGSVLSAPIPRFHPGHNSELLPRSFNFNASIKILQDLGFSLKENPFTDTDDKNRVLTLNIKTLRKGTLLNKIIVESLQSVGIRVNLFGPEDIIPEQEDLTLTAIKLPWPELNMIHEYHSKSKSKQMIDEDKKMDLLLTEYALSLSREKPNFKILKKIHAQFYSHEPMTIIMRHDYCLQVGNINKSW